MGDDSAATLEACSEAAHVLAHFFGLGVPSYALGSNQESSSDDRYREDNDHQIFGEPIGYTGIVRPSASLVLCLRLAAEEAGQM
jgi:hypothetical protein